MTSADATFKCLCVNDFAVYNFSRAALNVIHSPHPFHLIFCFQPFRDTFGFRHIINKLCKSFLRLLVKCVKKIFKNLKKRNNLAL